MRPALADGYDQAAELFEDLFGGEIHVVHQARRSPDGTGCTIVSRTPPVAVQHIDLCVTDRVDPADFVGQATAVEVATAVGRVLFVNHKPSWRLALERERELQAVGAARAV